jgi:3-(3-hydroxy-phenyl)propionate hydroxylase
MNIAPRPAADPVPVVIVGAGPVGVTAATLLGQYGVGCLVLDRWDGVYPQPRAVHLDDEIYRVLVRIGIGEQFAAVSRPTRGLQLIDRDHRVFAMFDRAGDQGRHGLPMANMFDQPELEHLMRTNLKDQATVKLRGNVEVTDVAQDGQGRVRVDFTDRLTGEPESVLATYVLGCDGANSVVRTAIGTTMEDLQFEQRWLVIDVASRVELDQWEGVHQVCDPGRAATYMRIGDARYRWEFRLLEGETAADFESIEALQPLIGPWVEGIACDQLELVRVAEYHFRAQLADRWRDRNVFLLGDAAHLTPPFIGQGLGAGVRDAMNLSWKIAGVVSGDLPESVLDTYEVERKPHARALIRLAKLIGVAMTQGGKAGDLLRKAIAPRLHWIPAVRDRLLDSQTPPLRRSALVEGCRLRRSLNGRLCPNALLADGTRYDDMTRGGFVLVTGVPLPPHLRALLVGRGTQVLEVQPGSPLHTWLVDGKAAAALVRPDFTVLRAGRDVAALCEAAPRFRGVSAVTASGFGEVRIGPGADHASRAPGLVARGEQVVGALE